MMTLFVAFLLVVAAGGLEQGSPAETPTKSPRAGPDPCALLTSAEIRAVQGETVSATRRDDHNAGDLRLLQCFYTTPTFAKSVSLTIAVADPPRSSAPRRYWEEHFHGAEHKEARRSPATAETEDNNEDADRRPPVKVMGIGEEAFWTGTRVSGALYVLSKDRFLRISVGGADDEQVKLGKSKQLLERVLLRLSGRRSRRP